MTGAGGRVRRESRWLGAVSAVLPPPALAAARGFAAVARLQPVARFRHGPAPDTVRPAGPALLSLNVDSLYGASAMPFRRLRMFPLVNRGLRGAGVRIGVLDSGFETGLAPFAGAIVGAQYDFVFNDSIVRNEPADHPQQSAHGTSVWSLLAADVPTTLIGVAPDATYLLAKTEDIRSETPLEEDNFVAALEWADSIGVDIVTASIGYLTFDGGSGYVFDDLNGDIAVTTVAADSAVARGIAVFAAIGNGGPASRSLITPADGDSVIAVGAEDSLGTVADFSARGPTADARIKPDFTAPGVAVWVAQATGGTAVYTRGSGTSFATPLLAGAAALFFEAHAGYGPIALRDAFRRSADQRTAPDTIRGWGRPDVLVATTYPRGLAMVESGNTITSVMPRFTWTVPDAPAFAVPFLFQLRVTRSGGPGITLLDTALADTTIALPMVLHGGVGLTWRLVATSQDTATFRITSDSVLTVPPWVTLETLDDPAGATTSEFRPEFRWSSPDVGSPPGPFLYTIVITRADNAAVEVVEDSLTTLSFVPPIDLERNTPYRWRVTAQLGTDEETTESRGTFVVLDESAPPITTLFQNFPNPFPRPATGQLGTCLWFDLATDATVSLEILDLRGLVVRRLIPTAGFGPFLRAGRYGRPAAGLPGCDPRMEWDGTRSDGSAVNPGVYLAKLATPDGTFFKRIVYLGGDP